jgi:hypothetical protein
MFWRIFIHGLKLILGSRPPHDSAPITNTSHAPGIFLAVIVELADGIMTSLVSVMTKVDIDIFES